MGQVRFLLSALVLCSSAAMADECSVRVESTDQMTFNTHAIDVSSRCTTFTVNLVHVGQLSAEVMGHNWVLTRQTDVRQVATDGLRAGEGSDYLKPGDPRVIAATKLIGGGESTSVSFAVAKLEKGVDYTFFCSFPGHVAMMRGRLQRVD